MSLCLVSEAVEGAIFSGAVSCQMNVVLHMTWQGLTLPVGLAFDSWDLDYYTALFQRVRRNPTSVECFDLAQSNRSDPSSSGLQLETPLPVFRASSGILSFPSVFPVVPVASTAGTGFSAAA